MRTKAALISALTRQTCGTEEVVDWLEYAVKHGVEHLVPFRNMKASYVAYHNLDVALAILLLSLFMPFVVWHLVSNKCVRQLLFITKYKKD